VKKTLLKRKKEWKPTRRALAHSSKTNSRAQKSPLMDSLAAACRAEGACRRCGCGGVLHADHILTRGAHPALMDEPLNYMPLCPDCHRWKDDKRGEYNEWLEETHSGLRERLLTIEQAKSKGFR
jgi:hypothetical protein